MATTSPNGWPLLAKERTTTFAAGGRRWRTAPGLVASVFAAFLNRYALEVEPIVDEPATKGQLDDWGWADRPQRDTTSTPSNHWSGTAVDVNSLQHLRGVEDTFTPTELAALRALLADFPVLRWGGDYRSVVDDMHIEINVTPRVLAVWCARHLPAAAVSRATGSPTRPTPQEDDVVTRADMETIADLVVERWSQRTLEAPHPVNAGQSAPISFENLLRRAASVIPDGVKRGVLRTPEDWAVEILDRELVRAPHPVNPDEIDDITLRMALGRAASVIPGGIARGVLHDPVDLEEGTLLTGEVVGGGWSEAAQASLRAGLEAQLATAEAVEKIGNHVEELLGIAGWLYERATVPEPVLIAGSTDRVTQAEMVAQTHARTVQVAGLVAGVAGALNVLATAAAKGRMADAQVLQDVMLSTMSEALPQVIPAPTPADSSFAPATPTARATRGA